MLRSRSTRDRVACPVSRRGPADRRSAIYHSCVEVEARIRHLLLSLIEFADVSVIFPCRRWRRCEPLLEGEDAWPRTPRDLKRRFPTLYSLEFSAVLCRGEAQAIAAKAPRRKKVKFPEVYESKLDMGKVKLEVLRAWALERLTKLMGYEDEVLRGNVEIFFAFFLSVLSCLTLLFSSRLHTLCFTTSWRNQSQTPWSLRAGSLV